MEFPRLKKKYIDEIAPGLMEKLQYKSVMQVPLLYIYSRFQRLRKLRSIRVWVLLLMIKN